MEKLTVSVVHSLMKRVDLTAAPIGVDQVSLLLTMGSYFSSGKDFVKLKKSSHKSRLHVEKELIEPL